MYKKLFALLLLITSLFGLSSQKLPDNVISFLNQYPEVAQCYSRMRITPQEIPETGYYIKSGIERFSNAEKLRTLIEIYNLNHILIPDKFLYHVPNQANELSNENYVVISKKINGIDNFKLNINQAKQLFFLAQKAQLFDLHKKNLLVTNAGKVALIDTDSYMMAPIEESKFFKLIRIFMKNNPFNCFYLQAQEYLDYESLEWLEKEYKKHNFKLFTGIMCLESMVLCVASLTNNYFTAHLKN